MNENGITPQEDAIRAEKLDDLRIMVDAAFKRRFPDKESGNALEIRSTASPENPVAKIIKDQMAEGIRPEDIYFSFGHDQKPNEVRVDNPDDYQNLLLIVFNKAIKIRTEYYESISQEYITRTPEELEAVISNKVSHEKAHAKRALQCEGITKVDYSVLISQETPESILNILPNVVLTGRANAYDVIDIFNAPDDPSESDLTQAGGFTKEQLRELTIKQTSSSSPATNLTQESAIISDIQ